MKNGVIFACLGLFSYYLIINFTDFSPQIAGILYSRGALVYTVVAFVMLGFVTLRLTEWSNSRYMQQARKRWQVVSVQGVVALLFLLLNYSLIVMAKLLADVSPIWAFSHSGWHILFIVWLAEMMIMGLLLSNRTLQVNQSLRQEAARLQIENTQARYEALQSQLNPHFLFNSLNTLVAEIAYNPDNAVLFTRHLSHVYRYVLQCHNRQLVTLSEELTFVDSYLFLHQVRIGHYIRCVTHLPDTWLDCQLPPLTLQLLVENVIKHNVISKAKPMEITLMAEGDYLVVSNPIALKKNSREESSGIGLQNLSTRCQIVCDRPLIILSNDPTRFTVKIPVIQ